MLVTWEQDTALATRTTSKAMSEAPVLPGTVMIILDLARLNVDWVKVVCPRAVSPRAVWGAVPMVASLAAGLVGADWAEMDSQDLELAGPQDMATVGSRIMTSAPAMATPMPGQVLPLPQDTARTSSLIGAKAAPATAVLTTQHRVNTLLVSLVPACLTLSRPEASPARTRARQPSHQVSHTTTRSALSEASQAPLPTMAATV